MKKHGYGINRGKNPTYRSWESMKYRCDNPSYHFYAAYGGRGIKYCERWKEFKNFLEDMGERPDGMTLDRIDVNKNYEPKNCRWADAKTQRANRRDIKLYEYQGNFYMLGRLAKDHGLSVALLYQRIHRDKMSIEVAVNKPRRTKNFLVSPMKVEVFCTEQANYRAEGRATI